MAEDTVRQKRYARWCNTCGDWIDITTPCEHQDDDSFFEWKKILWENGTLDATAEVDHFAIKLLAASFMESLADAPNYTETTVYLKPQFEAEVKVVVTVVRPGHKTPHELRLDAERRAEAAETRLQECLAVQHSQDEVDG